MAHSPGCSEVPGAGSPQHSAQVSSDGALPWPTPSRVAIGSPHPPNAYLQLSVLHWCVSNLYNLADIGANQYAERCSAALAG